MRTYLSAYHMQLYGREEQCKPRFQPGQSTTKAPMSSTHTLGKSLLLMCCAFHRTETYKNAACSPNHIYAAAKVNAF